MIYNIREKEILKEEIKNNMNFNIEEIDEGYENFLREEDEDDDDDDEEEHRETINDICMEATYSKYLYGGLEDKYNYFIERYPEEMGKEFKTFEEFKDKLEKEYY